MDVITDLPASLNFEKVQFDCILVVVNWLTKMAHFIPTTKKLTSEESWERGGGESKPAASSKHQHLREPKPHAKAKSYDHVKQRHNQG
ncbi:hypothetical protein CIRG_03802 [Coccidioides immitis RMSCC 2394]|uniref:Uncharacterized protein n=1 Tax=Coccidioides immitis RMSCC 2394 TaxID=404692 RepID=A0A0J6Y633_COCIT|nr:hypothetical protein CIRG_03802 [Coccidioides immitis RMSCC 2394]